MIAFIDIGEHLDVVSIFLITCVVACSIFLYAKVGLVVGFHNESFYFHKFDGSFEEEGDSHSAIAIVQEMFEVKRWTVDWTSTFLIGKLFFIDLFRFNVHFSLKQQYFSLLWLFLLLLLGLLWPFYYHFNLSNFTFILGRNSYYLNLTLFWTIQTRISLFDFLFVIF